jgi:F0F1-type ATP synthase membrane subunit c/vacuolar-type H+-ATPase subunit K
MRKSRGVSYVVTVAIMTAVTIALGLFLWGIVSGWAGVSAIGIVAETNKGIAQQRSILVVEFIDWGRGIVWVSNPGKVDLVILSCAIYPKSASPPPISYREIAKVNASMNSAYPLEIGSKCQLVTGQKPYVIEIRAIASTIYNPNNPLENAQWMIMVRQNV